MASQLDYILAPRGAKVIRYQVQPFWASDHCLVRAELELSAGARGPGFWKMNVTHLQDPSFLSTMHMLYLGWQSLKVLYSTEVEWWEDTKAKVAKFCQWWGRNAAKEKREKIAQWSRTLQVSWARGDMGGAKQASEVLRDHFYAEARGYSVQAGRRRLLEDERPTRFFFDRVRARQRRSHMEGLREGELLITSMGGMLERAAAYYEDLFQPRSMGEVEAGDFLKAVDRRVAQEDLEDLEAELTQGEVEEAMRSLKGGVAPGGDGLPVEWYKAVWPWASRDIMAVFEEIIKKGLLPETARTGYITLLHKKGERAELANWRPITLLCADYKILAKVLAQRLKKVMSTVVHPDQTCGVPGRSSSMNLALIRDAIAWAQQRRLPLALLGLDQEKAFDRVNHRFLLATLQRMGFGEKFLSFIRLLYRGAVSRVGINGHFSRAVAQAGGVRQGCPVSPLLYVLYLEPLLARFRKEHSFLGLHIPGGEGVRAKVTAYADDTTLFLASEGDFGVVERILAAFTEATGARVNRRKSSVLFVGSWAHRMDVPGGFSLCPDGLRILGVRFWRERSEVRNWEEALVRLQAKAARWAARDLSLTGRVVAVNCDLFASLIHLSYVFPVPFWTGRRIERALFSLVWGGKCEWVARGTMYLEVGKGGRGVVCAPLKLAALYVSHLAGLVRGTEGHLASLFARFWFGFPLRSVIPWKGTLPWSADRPGHYGRAMDIIKGMPWCLRDAVVLDNRLFYRQWKKGHIEGVAGQRPRSDIDWGALQPKWLDGPSRDLHWLGAMGRLPVRERLYRHGQSSTPLCPMGCGSEEDIGHALWECPIAAGLWQQVSGWWARRDRTPIDRELVLYGKGARNNTELWKVVSVAKRVLWGGRGGCIRERKPGLEPQSLFHAFLRGMARVEQLGGKGTRADRAGVG